MRGEGKREIVSIVYILTFWWSFVSKEIPLKTRKGHSETGSLPNPPN